MLVYMSSQEGRAPNGKEDGAPQALAADLVGVLNASGQSSVSTESTQFAKNAAAALERAITHLRHTMFNQLQRIDGIIC